MFLHLIVKQYGLKERAELCNNLNIFSTIELIYYISGYYSYFHGTTRIVTTQCEHL